MLESEFHEWLKKRIATGPDTLLGLGDDAAVLACTKGMAVASDILVEEVHYKKGEASPTEIGAKAVNRNLSDMAAMGLKPHWILVSAALPGNRSEEFIKALVEGMIKAAARFGVSLVGGDTSRSPSGLVVDVTVLGRIEDLDPVPRSGAMVHDRILVTGSLGGSSLGKHLRFTPRVKEGVFLNRGFNPTAMIDISDGLALDLCRILDASGKGALLEGDRIPISQAAHTLARTTGKQPLDHALSDGEDFELLFTLPPERAKKLKDHPHRGFEVTEIGGILEDPKERHLKVCGSIKPLEREGYDHRI